MPGTLASTAITTEILSLEERMIYNVDYVKLSGIDFGHNDEIIQSDKIQEIINCYKNIKETNDLIVELLSASESLNIAESTMQESSVLIDDSKETINEALNSAEFFKSVQLSQREDEELSIAIMLKNIKEVTAIYTQRYRSELQIIVFLNTEKYDNELMYKLLDIEYMLHNQFRDPLLAFSYIPKVQTNIREIIHPSAKLIYERE